MPKVSIIIPIYNAEKYLGEMLESLQRQSLTDIEIICVLDCPKDASAEVLRTYAKEDDRIRILENECNMGAGPSRNRGLKEAQASYVCFFDADDIFEPDLLEKAYAAITANAADIVLYEHDTFSEQRPYAKLDVETPSKYKMPFRLKDLPEEALLFWNCTPWNKMYSKAFVEQNQLEYQDLSSSNDVYFSDMSMLLAEKIVHIGTDKRYVHHRVSTSTQISANRDPMNAWYAIKYLYDELCRLGKLEENKKYFYTKFLHTITYDLRMSKSQERAKETYDLIREQGGTALGIYGLDEKDFENPYYAQEIRKFIFEEYESRWFDQFIKLRVRMKRYADRMLKMYEAFEADNASIAVWGAGPGGRTVLRFFDEYDKRISWVIDNDKNKQGRLLEGREIMSFDSIVEQVDVVLVPNDNFYAAINQQVKQCREDIKVINLNEYFG